MKILLLSPEHPLQRDALAGATVGRDVEALALAHVRAGHEVRLAFPCYGPCDRSDPAWATSLPIEVHPVRAAPATILHRNCNGIDTRLVVHPLLERPHRYLDNQGQDHHDNALRFGVFCAAVLAESIRDGWIPDVIQAHEWQSGLALLYAAHHLREFLGGASRVFSLQDAAFQGLADPSWLEPLGLGPEWLAPDRLEFWGRINLLKAGLLHAERVTVPSRHYQGLLLEGGEGRGLDGLFRSLGSRLQAVHAGIDVTVWSLPADVGSPEALRTFKEHNRRELIPGDQAVVSFVSSFRSVKGIDLILTLLPDLLRLPLRLVFLGGQGTDAHRHLKSVDKDVPGHLMLLPRSDESLHRVLLASDMVLMPAARQPGGVLYARAMALGTPVVAHKVGAMADRVVPWPQSEADGFLFENFAPEQLLRQLRKALAVYAQPESWWPLAFRASRRDFGWEQAATAYRGQCLTADGGA